MSLGLGDSSRRIRARSCSCRFAAVTSATLTSNITCGPGRSIVEQGSPAPPPRCRWPINVTHPHRPCRCLPGKNLRSANASSLFDDVVGLRHIVTGTPPSGSPDPARSEHRAQTTRWRARSTVSTSPVTTTALVLRSARITVPVGSAPCNLFDHIVGVRMHKLQHNGLLADPRTVLYIAPIHLVRRAYYQHVALPMHLEAVGTNDDRQCLDQTSRHANES